SSWDYVLNWFESQSGLRRLEGQSPEGTVSLTIDNRALPEVIDILNEHLIPLQLILDRREESFTVRQINRVPGARARRVSLSDLSKLGKTEFVQVLIPVADGKAQKIAEELREGGHCSQFGVMDSFG